MAKRETGGLGGVGIFGGARAGKEAVKEFTGLPGVITLAERVEPGFGGGAPSGAAKGKVVPKLGIGIPEGIGAGTGGFAERASLPKGSAPELQYASAMGVGTPGVSGMKVAKRDAGKAGAPGYGGAGGTGGVPWGSLYGTLRGLEGIRKTGRVEKAEIGVSSPGYGGIGVSKGKKKVSPREEIFVSGGLGLALAPKGKGKGKGKGIGIVGEGLGTGAGEGVGAPGIAIAVKVPKKVTPPGEGYGYGAAGLGSGAGTGSGYAKAKPGELFGGRGAGVGKVVARAGVGEGGGSGIGGKAVPKEYSRKSAAPSECRRLSPPVTIIAILIRLLT